LVDNYGSAANTLETSEWTIGDYTFQVRTDADEACGLEAESVVKPLLLLKGELTIEADGVRKYAVKFNDTGTYVDVFVDDVLYARLHNLVIEADGTFSKEVITTDVRMTVLGSVMLKAWLDCAKRPDESFDVWGNASSDYVEIVFLSAEGGNGTGIDGLYGTTIYTVPTFCNSTNYFNNFFLQKAKSR